MTLVNGHSHDSSSMKKSQLVRNADRDVDHDELRNAIDEVVSSLSFLDEWGYSREPRIHLEQSSGRIVDYLVEQWCETPEWLQPQLHHVPPDKWREHGVRP